MRHDELIADAVEARGGRLLKSMGEGDSTVSVFDSAPAAVEAAIAANRSAGRRAWPGIAHRRALGLHTGEAERRGADYSGPTVNLAARLRAQADGGQIFLSSVTAELVAAHLPEGYPLVDLGPHRLGASARRSGSSRSRGRASARRRRRRSARTAACRRSSPPTARFFFGREEVVAELIGGSRPAPLLAVVGASGSGKSSVLRAGLVAAARAGEVDGCDHASL